VEHLVDYHLKELEIARDPTHPKHLNPPVRPGDRVLDIGCGAGQTLIVTCPGRTSFGIDIDLEPLQVGKTLTKDVAFSVASAEELPFKSESFDFVASRVSLPYTRLNRSLSEVSRVLRPGGRFWATLHPFRIAWEQAKEGSWKGWVFFAYVVSNGLLFHATGRQFRFRGRMESIQTSSGMQRELKRLGFTDIRMTRGFHFLIEATKGKTAK